ncbi:MAG TPA: YkgJ family cysteine cluster protein [Bryobacteraceae bacterium]|nr:YkgJ family cysteine cluster protein [Bryobacteraceae bacterium]
MHELRFRCIPGCTKCCDTQGFVYLSEADLLRAAEYVGMTAAQFEAKYVYRTRTLLRLRKPRRQQCPFLHADGCGIHPAKPTQCRLYPFWPELVERRRAWRAAARSCPGIGTGPLIQIGTAVETANEMRTAYPGLYRDRKSPGRQNRLDAKL